MRSFARSLGNILAALSLLLSLGLAGMWARSYWQNEKGCRWWYSKQTDETKLLSLASERGKVELTLLRTKYPSGVVFLEERAEETKLIAPGFSCSYPNGWWKFSGTVAPPPRQHPWEYLGIFVRLETGLRWSMSPGVGSSMYLGAPYWLLFVLTISAPALCILRWWKLKRRFDQGRCAKCGYDLRETPDRCPECGAAAEEVVLQSSGMN